MICKNYIKILRNSNIALVPEKKVHRVCKEAERLGVVVCGGAIQETPDGIYQWLYREAA